MNEIIYLDVCSLKRPFDDAAVERVRREAEASAARWFVTTDDRLLKRAEHCRLSLRVEAVRPDEVPLGDGKS